MTANPVHHILGTGGVAGGELAAEIRVHRTLAETVVHPLENLVLLRVDLDPLLAVMLVPQMILAPVEVADTEGAESEAENC